MGNQSTIPIYSQWTQLKYMSQNSGWFFSSEVDSQFPLSWGPRPRARRQRKLRINLGQKILFWISFWPVTYSYSFILCEIMNIAENVQVFSEHYGTYGLPVNKPIYEITMFIVCDIMLPQTVWMVHLCFISFCSFCRKSKGCVGFHFLMSGFLSKNLSLKT